MSTSDDEPAERERHVRGKALVTKVLSAAVAELARVGYEKLSIEDVAVAAGVNKTTLYRRWATKRDLILAALEKVAHDIPPPANLGSLRLDMLSQVKLHRDLAARPDIRGLMRMAFAGPPPEEIAEFSNGMRAEKEAEAMFVYTRAIDRGELPADTDVQLLHTILSGTVTELVLFRHDECDDAKLTRVVDLVLLGAMPRR